MNKLDLDYCNLLQDILDNGIKKQDRTGTGTLSVFGRTIRHKMSKGFPILTTKHISLRNVATELIWFLKGSSDIRYLWENNCHIWDGDWEKKYKKSCSSPYTIEEIQEKLKNKNHHFHDSMFDLGPIYGSQWRKWKTFIPYDVTEENCKVATSIDDQIKNLVNDLKNNPDSRRLMVSAWNVSDLDKMILPPCHYGFQCYTKELQPRQRTEVAKQLDIKLSNGIKSSEEWDKECDEKNVPKRALSLIWNQRSVDTFLGLPYNIASYGLLLEILAKEVNMVPDELIGNLGDTHLYLNHLEQAKEQIGRDYTEEERQEMFQTTGFDAMIDCENKRELYNLISKRTRKPYPLPKLMFMSHLKDFKSLLFDETYGVVLRPKDFILDNYNYHPKIEAPLSN